MIYTKLEISNAKDVANGISVVLKYITVNNYIDIDQIKKKKSQIRNSNVNNIMNNVSYSTCTTWVSLTWQCLMAAGFKHWLCSMRKIVALINEPGDSYLCFPPYKLEKWWNSPFQGT